MIKTKTTPVVQELIRRGLKRHNAYRVANAKKVSQPVKILRDVLSELLELKARDRKP